MILRIARKEVTEMLRDGRLRASAVIVLLLLGAALATGWMHTRAVQRTHDAAQAAAREHWVTQAPKTAHSAAHYGLYAFKPKLPLAFVDRGVDPYVGVFAWLEAHKRNEFSFRPVQDATFLERFGAWTASSVLQLLVPLLIVMAGFAAFAGERERGTLRQLLALGVPSRTLMAGKGLGIAASLGLVLVPGAILGSAALVLFEGNGTDGDVWARIAVLALVYLAYFTLFLVLTLAVSMRATMARTALVVLLGFWSVNALAAPRAAAEVARAVHPAPSALDFNLALERDLSQGNDVDALRDSVLAAHGVRSVDSLPFNFSGLSLQRGEEHGDHVFDEHYGRLARVQRAHAGVERWFAALSPLLAVRTLSMALSGTDEVQHRHFADAAERYRRTLVKAMNDATLEYPRGAEGRGAQSDEQLWRQVAPFTYEAPDVGDVLAAHVWEVVIIVGWMIAALVAASRAVARTSAIAQGGL